MKRSVAAQWLIAVCMVAAVAAGSQYIWVTRFSYRHKLPAEPDTGQFINGTKPSAAAESKNDSVEKTAAVAAPARVQTDVPTPAVAAVDEKPKPADHFPIDISAAFNAFIGANWKRENHDDDGLPGDGRVLVPGVVPRAYFRFVPPDEPNAIELGAGPATLVVPRGTRGQYGRLAVLHGSSSGDVKIRATLHYDTGADFSHDLAVQDWNRRAEPKEVFVHKALQAGRIQLYSQIVKLDPSRVLETITFESGPHAVIFALTAIVSSDRPFDGGK